MLKQNLMHTGEIKIMASTYTKKELDQMLDMYVPNPCLEVVGRLSVLLNRPKKSIISKLSKEGVYVTQGYRTKSGGVPITKLQILRSIEQTLGNKLPGLDKAPKTTLNTLNDEIVDLATSLEDALGELKETSETRRVQEEILELRRK